MYNWTRFIAKDKNLTGLNKLPTKWSLTFWNLVFSNSFVLCILCGNGTMVLLKLIIDSVLFGKFLKSDSTNFNPTVCCLGYVYISEGLINLNRKGFTLIIFINFAELHREMTTLSTWGTLVPRSGSVKKRSSTRGHWMPVYWNRYQTNKWRQYTYL